MVIFAKEEGKENNRRRLEDVKIGKEIVNYTTWKDSIPLYKSFDTIHLR